MCPVSVDPCHLTHPLFFRLMDGLHQVSDDVCPWWKAMAAGGENNTAEGTLLEVCNVSQNMIYLSYNTWQCSHIMSCYEARGGLVCRKIVGTLCLFFCRFGYLFLCITLSAVCCVGSLVYLLTCFLFCVPVCLRVCLNHMLSCTSELLACSHVCFYVFVVCLLSVSLLVVCLCVRLVIYLSV